MNNIYILTAQTNLHAGSGDANYGIIDSLVQRDALTDLPCIHASSLKGSILQHFISKKVAYSDVKIIFGQQNTDRQKRLGITTNHDTTGKSGEFVFMQANLLTIPIRSSVRPFFHVTCPQILKDLSETLDNLNLNTALSTALKAAAERENVILNGVTMQNLYLEDKTMTVNAYPNPNLVMFFPNDTLIVDDETFKNLTDNHHLPVIAHNHLENGQSKNLWYEQVLPRQTRFFFAIMDLQKDGEINKIFNNTLTNGIVQVGANASVGYGYCKIEKKF